MALPYGIRMYKRLGFVDQGDRWAHVHAEGAGVKRGNELDDCYILQSLVHLRLALYLRLTFEKRHNWR